MLLVKSLRRQADRQTDGRTDRQTGLAGWLGVARMAGTINAAAEHVKDDERGRLASVRAFSTLSRRSVFCCQDAAVVVVLVGGARMTRVVCVIHQWLVSCSFDRFQQASRRRGQALICLTGGLRNRPIPSERASDRTVTPQTRL